MKRIISNLALEKRRDERGDRKKLLGPSQRKAAVSALQGSALVNARRVGSRAVRDSVGPPPSHRSIRLSPTILVITLLRVP
jgi:hypothetical protein